MLGFYSQVAFQAVAHGVVQGGFSSLTGGSFWSGFAAGALSSIAASAWTGGTNVDADGKSIAGTGWGGAGKYANSGPGMIAFGTVVGGASAELTGGNFWMGAASGFMVSYLNHAMHAMDGEGDPPNKYKNYFQRKSNEIEQSYNTNKQGLRQIFDTAEIAGGTVEIVGSLAAPFTEGASLELAAEGFKWSAFGTAGNVLMDGIEGNYENAFYRTLKFSTSFGMGRAIESGIPSKYAQYLLNSVKSFSETYVLPVIEDSWNKFNPPKPLKN